MKEPVVTRTIKNLKVTYLAINLETREVTNTTASVPAYLKEKDKVMKYLLALYDKDVEAGLSPLKPVEIVGAEVTESLRGMTERTFIENSYEIPPRQKNNTEE